MQLRASKRTQFDTALKLTREQGPTARSNWVALSLLLVPNTRDVAEQCGAPLAYRQRRKDQIAGQLKERCLARFEARNSERGGKRSNREECARLWPGPVSTGERGFCQKTRPPGVFRFLNDDPGAKSGSFDGIVGRWGYSTWNATE